MIPAASFDLKGFQTLYSVVVAGAASPFVVGSVVFALFWTWIRFSP
jgi:hypothetical protein